MTVLRDRLGHALAGLAEDAKIAVAQRRHTTIDLFEIERDLRVRLTEARGRRRIDDDLERIVQAARATVALAGLRADAIDALYFTGGSTGLRLLADRLRRAFPRRQAVHGDRFASVATGLGLHAQRHFGGRGDSDRRPAQPAQSASTAAIASAVGSTLPLFSPATHIRPERTR